MIVRGNARLSRQSEIDTEVKIPLVLEESTKVVVERLSERIGQQTVCVPMARIMKDDRVQTCRIVR